MKGTFIFSLLMSALAVSVRAMHPLITEDAGFLGRGTWQMETAFEHASPRAGGDDFSRALGVELAYGVTDSADLLLGLPWQMIDSGGVRESGHGDMSAELKFRAAEAAGWTLAFKPGFSLATGDEERGLGAGRAGYWLNLVLSRSAGALQYHFNAGWLRNANSSGERENIWKASAAAAVEVLPRTLAALDLAVETGADPAAEEHPASAVLGLVWSPLVWLDLDAGLKLGLNGAADDLGLLGGVALRF